MAKTPYEILGVEPGATQDEIKKAYRKKARENHPDLHPDDKDAAERMNEINEAYELLMNPEKYEAQRARAAAAQRAREARANGGYGAGGSYAGEDGGYGYGYGGPYGWTGGFGFDWDDIFSGGASIPAVEASAADSAQIKSAVSYMNSKSYQGALDILNAVERRARDARWYYLSSLANKGVGNEIVALDHIRKALTMEPNNETYKRTLSFLQNSGTAYTQTTQERGFRRTFSTGPLSWCLGCAALNACLNPYMCCYCL